MSSVSMPRWRPSARTCSQYSPLKADSVSEPLACLVTYLDVSNGIGLLEGAITRTDQAETTMGAVADRSMTGSVTAWLAMSADWVVKRLATDREKGLDTVEAARRLQAYGPNRLHACRVR